MITRTQRAATALSAVLAVALLLAACSPRLPGREALETAIPAALLASDLGILDAEASTSNSGLSVSVWVEATFDRSSISAEDLRTVLSAVVDNTNVANIERVEISGIDGTAEGRTHIDLGSLGAELGFAPSSSFPEYFTGDWDDVVEYLRE